MPEYLSPGVYMEEQDKGPKPIEGVGTAMPVFIGFTEKAWENGRKFINTPELVTSWEQYTQKFGDYMEGTYLPHSVNGFFLNGGNRCYVVSVQQLERAQTVLDVKIEAPAENGSTDKPQKIKPGKRKAEKDETEKIEPAALSTKGIKVLARLGVESNRIQIAVSKIEPIAADVPKQEPSAQQSASEDQQNATVDDANAGDAHENPVPNVDPLHQSQSSTHTSSHTSSHTSATPAQTDQVIGYTVTLTATSTQILASGRKQEDNDSFRIRLTKDSENKTTIAYLNNTESRLVVLSVLDEMAPFEEIVPVEQKKFLTRPLLQIPEPDKSKFDGGFRKGDNVDDVTVRTGMAAIEALDDVTMLIAPDVMIRRKAFAPTAQWDYLDADNTAYEGMVKRFQSSLVDHCSNLRFQDRLAIVDVPFGKTPQEAKEWRKITTNFDSSYAAMYYPWIKVADPVTRQDIFVPPSGHMAGVWARTDNTRGVHKAPANEVVMGAIGLEYVMTKGEHDVLNPEGVNCIRSFPGQGIRAYGARTLSSNPSWRYIPIRRTMNFIKKSIERGTQWVVFEPNDARLWAKIRRDVGAFLTNVWREGMLFGLSPQEAFYVTCDETLNPSETRREGKLFIEIGIQPVYPAEFVIFRISQWAGPGSEE